MCDLLLIPFHNRSFPWSIAVNQSGIIAYGSRSHIYFLDATKSPLSILDDNTIFGAHKSFVKSLSFSKDDEFLSSIGDDGELKIWDIKNQMQNKFTTKVKENIKVMEWMYGNSNFVYFPYDCRTLGKLNLKTQSIIKIKTGSHMTVILMASNEKFPNLLALGHTNGFITIMDVVQEKQLQVFKVHAGILNCISWSPNAPDMLLSVGADSLRLWKLKENNPVLTYYFRRPRGKGFDKNDNKNAILAVCHPTKPNTVICNNFRGDVGEVIFSDNKPTDFYPYCLIHPEACRSGIAAFCVRTGSDDSPKDYFIFWDNNKVSQWDTDRKVSVCQTFSLTGHVFDLANSPLNPNVLAIGNGDGLLRVWDSDNATRFYTHSIYIHYRTKIFSVSWHPLMEHILAYGTEEGRVGVVDLYKRKVLYYYEAHHSNSVYNMCWGPCKKNSESGSSTFYIYSCGGGKVHINKQNDNKATQDFEELASIPDNLDSVEKSLSFVAWKPDYSCLAVASYKGYIDLYNDTFEFIVRYNVQLKSVECLVWHPMATAKSSDGSPLNSWLACCGQDIDIHIFDTSAVKTDGNNCVTESARKLIGHQKRVRSLCWSPHVDEHIVSCSHDCTIRIWDVLTGNSVATYFGHYDHVNALQWSSLDPDVIYSGGMDSCVRKWKISESNRTSIDKVPSSKVFRKIIKKGSKGGELEDTSPEKSTNESAAVKLDVPVQKENAEKPDTESEKQDTVEDGIIVDIPRNPLIPRMQGRKNILFPEHMPLNIQPASDLEDCIRLADIISHRSAIAQSDGFLAVPPLEDRDVMKFGPFVDQISALKMLEAQSRCFLGDSNHPLAVQLGLMAGNIEEHIRDAADKGRLTSFLVSLALTVSYVFSLEMCEKYADQLMNEHLFYSASSYYLMCGKIYQAIDVIANKGNIIDAVVLAKARLPPSDPLINSLLKLANKKYSNLGVKTVEAKCNLALNEPLSAAKTIASLGSMCHLKAAAHICRKFNLYTEAEEYSFQALEKCLEQLDWPAFQALAEQESRANDFQVLVTVHEAFYNHLRQLKKFEAVSIKHVFSKQPHSKVTFYSGFSSPDSEQYFIEHVYQLLVTKSLIPSDSESLEKALKDLKLFSSKRRTAHSAAQAHISIAVHITEIIYFMLLEKKSQVKETLLKILCLSYNTVILPKTTFMLFFP